MPRPLWSGSISFGLVNIPIKLFRAQAPKDVRFHQLHAADGVRIQQKRVCPADEQEVAYQDIVKGYDLGGDRYVVVDPDELDALDPKATRTIDIEDFVEASEIDPLLYENGYHVVPDARSEKAYGLFVNAMAETNKVAIGKFVMRSKEHLCTLRTNNNALVLETMLFADEVVSLDEVMSEANVESGDKQTKPDKRELAMATQLIESLTTKFDLEKYHDEYREKVMELIEAKAAGNEIAIQPEAPEVAPVVDLMAALEASLDEAKKQQSASKKGAREKRRAHA